MKISKALEIIARLDHWLDSRGVKVWGLSPVVVIIFGVPFYCVLAAFYYLIFFISAWLFNDHPLVITIFSLTGIFGFGVLALSYAIYCLLLPFSFIGHHFLSRNVRFRQSVLALVHAAYFFLWVFFLYVIGLFEFLQNFSFREFVDEAGSVIGALMAALFLTGWGFVISFIAAPIIYGFAAYWDIMKFIGKVTEPLPPFIHNSEFVNRWHPSLVAEWGSVTAFAYLFAIIIAVHAMLQSDDPEIISWQAFVRAVKKRLTRFEKS